MSEVLAMRHTGLVVSDMDVCLRFYTEILGLKYAEPVLESGACLETVLKAPGVRVRTAKLGTEKGTGVLELLQFLSPYEDSRKESRSFCQHGLTHVAFTVQDVSRLKERIEKAGGSSLSEPVPTTDGKYLLLFCRDPEGNLLELVQFLN
ncbi:VOC family protein [uncultured Mailhella sp.]|uniref:VOC family protein n=1 Tax=uncultured Mailhella sp. TaxID=1981031 RepID=UPI00261E0592|nr:VOC family protein [uncultured Mailhella sp.]